MTDERREQTEPVDQTAEWENPFVPAPLGDTNVMEFHWDPRAEDLVP
jgi:hypothetical protein